MKVDREADGSLKSSVSWDALPAVKTIWHPNTVDVLTLKANKRHRSGVHEVLYNDRPAISKIACSGGIFLALSARLLHISDWISIEMPGSLRSLHLFWPT